MIINRVNTETTLTNFYADMMKMYVEWFKLTLDECRQGHYFYGLDDYFNPLRDGYIALTGVEGRGLPLPPPGDLLKAFRSHLWA